MRKGLGSSLADAVDARVEIARVPAFPASVLSILSAVFSRPGITLTAAAEMCGIGFRSAREATVIALNTGFVVETVFFGNKGLLPIGRIAPENQVFLVLLANQRMSRLVKHVVGQPGTTVGDALFQNPGCGRKTVARVLDAGLLSCVGDGVYERLFPSEKLSEIARDIASWENSLARATVLRLMENGYDAVVETTPGGDIRVRVETSPLFYLSVSIQFPY